MKLRKATDRQRAGRQQKRQSSGVMGDQVATDLKCGAAVTKPPILQWQLYVGAGKNAQNATGRGDASHDTKNAPAGGSCTMEMGYARDESRLRADALAAWGAVSPLGLWATGVVAAQKSRTAGAGRLFAPRNSCLRQRF